MQIIVDVFNKSMVIDGEAVIVEKWENISLPLGVRTITYDTEAKSGSIVWMDDALPNWKMNDGMYGPLIAQFESIYTLTKVKQEQARIEAIRLAGEAAAAARLEETNAKLAAIKEKAAVLARLNVIETKLGIVHTTEDEKEPL